MSHARPSGFPDLPLRQKRQILAEWEAFIQSGFGDPAFRPTLATFLTRFLTDEPEHRAKIRLDVFDRFALAAIDLIYLFRPNPARDTTMFFSMAQARTQALQDPTTQDLMQAMIYGLDGYRSAWLRAWETYTGSASNR
jgi:hypothetical protein